MKEMKHDAVQKSSAVHGIPHRFTFKNIAGAFFSRAKPNRTREPMKRSVAAAETTKMRRALEAPLSEVV